MCCVESQTHPCPCDWTVAEGLSQGATANRSSETRENRPCGFALQCGSQGEAFWHRGQPSTSSLLCFPLLTCSVPDSILPEAVAAARLQVLSLAEADTGTKVGVSTSNSVWCFSHLL